jgi:hypothetical protein
LKPMLICFTAAALCFGTLLFFGCEKKDGAAPSGKMTVMHDPKSGITITTGPNSYYDPKPPVPLAVRAGDVLPVGDWRITLTSVRARHPGLHAVMFTLKNASKTKILRYAGVWVESVQDQHGNSYAVQREYAVSEPLHPGRSKTAAVLIDDLLADPALTLAVQVDAQAFTGQHGSKIVFSVPADKIVRPVAEIPIPPVPEAPAAKPIDAQAGERVRVGDWEIILQKALRRAEGKGADLLMFSLRNVGPRQQHMASITVAGVTDGKGGKYLAAPHTVRPGTWADVIGPGHGTTAAVLLSRLPETLPELTVHAAVKGTFIDFRVKPTQEETAVKIDPPEDEE